MEGLQELRRLSSLEAFPLPHVGFKRDRSPVAGANKHGAASRTRRKKKEKEK